MKVGEMGRNEEEVRGIVNQTVKGVQEEEEGGSEG